MTINNFQGQTLQMAGMYMPTDCFSHGQLYVALLHVVNLAHIKALVQQGRSAEHPSEVITKHCVRSHFALILSAPIAGLFVVW